MTAELEPYIESRTSAIVQRLRHGKAHDVKQVQIQNAQWESDLENYSVTAWLQNGTGTLDFPTDQWAVGQP